MSEFVSPRQRDRGRIRMARLAAQTACDKLSLLEECELDRLETDVALFDVRTDLEIARRHASNAAEALLRIEQAMR